MESLPFVLFCDVEIRWNSRERWTCNYLGVRSEKLPGQHAHLLHLGDTGLELLQSIAFVGVVIIKVGRWLLGEDLMEVDDHTSEDTVEGWIGVKVYVVGDIDRLGLNLILDFLAGFLDVGGVPLIFDVAHFVRGILILLEQQLEAFIFEIAQVVTFGCNDGGAEEDFNELDEVALLINLTE